MEAALRASDLVHGRAALLQPDLHGTDGSGAGGRGPKDSKEVVGKEKEAPPTAAYAMPCWKKIVNNSTVTVGVNNVFGEDPPARVWVRIRPERRGYPQSFAYDNVGRFWGMSD